MSPNRPLADALFPEYRCTRYHSRLPDFRQPELRRERLGPPSRRARASRLAKRENEGRSIHPSSSPSITVSRYSGTLTFQPISRRTSSASDRAACCSPWVRKSSAGRFLEVAEPLQQALAVGVAGDALDLPTRAPDQAVDAVDADLAVAVEDLPAQRALGLVADEEDRAGRVADVMGQVVLDAARPYTCPRWT